MSQEIIKLINDSFLSESDKRLALELLNTEGLSELFFKKFQDLLLKNIKSAGQDYVAAANSLNSGFVEVDAWFQRETITHDDEVAKQLEMVTDGDLKTKQEIWRTYDKKMVMLSADYKKRLDDVMSNAMASNIKW